MPESTACVSCGEEVNFFKGIDLGDGIAYACEVCGRLHLRPGVGVRIRGKQLEVFFLGGKIVCKNWKRLGNKPVGTFRCVICGKEWDGIELRIAILVDEARWGCHNLKCEGFVEKTSGSPKVEQVAPMAVL